MRKLSLGLICLASILISSCFLWDRDEPRLKINEEGEVISLPYLWKRSVQLGEPITNGSIDLQIKYDEKIILPMTNGPNGRLLAMVDPSDGEILWEWDDRFVQATEDILLYQSYQFNNLLFFPAGSRLYCINLENGETHWKSRNNLDRSFFSNVYGKGESFYMFGRSDSFPDSIDQTVIFKGNILNGQYEEYLIPDFTMDYFFPGNRIGDVTAALPLDLDGKEYLAVVWQEPFFEFFWQSYLGLYDQTTRQWVYQKTIINPDKSFNGVLLNPPVIYRDRIYLAVGFELACHDLRTGQQYWRKKFDGEIFFSNFLIEEDMVIVNNEDQYVYALDPMTGNQLWKIRGSGTSGEVSYMNGIVYFNGGASGRLHAVDIREGKTVWKIDPKLIGEFPDEIWWKTAIYTLPGENGKKGKVISLTGNNAYCFEAYR
jgi:outer membrane protein assembly factor BamB